MRTRSFLTSSLLLALGCCGCQSHPAVARTSLPHASSASRLRLLITVGNKVGYIDGAGKIVINPQYETAYGFAEGLAIVCVGECDLDHRIGYRASKDPTKLFENVEQTYKVGFIDESGRMVINPIYEDARNFSEGLAAVCSGKGCYHSLSSHDSDRKWGFIDKTGTAVIPPQFDDTYGFTEGFAAVSVGGKWGFIDKTGKFVINPQYDTGAEFKNGVAQVGLKCGSQCIKFGYIDKTGKYIWEPSN